MHKMEIILNIGNLGPFIANLYRQPNNQIYNAVASSPDKSAAKLNAAYASMGVTIGSTPSV